MNVASAYEDKDSKFMKKYWSQSSSLVVKGGCDFSQNSNGTVDDFERLKVFALLRLET